MKCMNCYHCIIEEGICRKCYNELIVERLRHIDNLPDFELEGKYDKTDRKLDFVIELLAKLITKKEFEKAKKRRGLSHFFT